MTVQLRDPGPMPVPRYVWVNTAESGLGAGLATWVAALWHVPVPFLVGTLLLAGIVATFSVLKHTAAPSGDHPFAAVMAAWTLFLPAWVGFAWWHGQVHWLTSGILAGGLLVLTVSTAHVWTNWLEEIEAWKANEEARRRARELGRWTGLFARLGLKGVKALRVESTRAGKDVHLKLPATVKLARLADTAENVAIDQDLPEDAVSFERDPLRASEVILHINSLDALAADLPFPALGDWLTIRKPIPVGMLADGRVMEVLVREVQILVIGMTGMGKSNLLNVLTALLTRCPDAMVWMIEFKGGRLPAPWIRPWAEHRAKLPAIDWVATTRAEAELMLRAAERLCEARSESLKGGSKIDPDRESPELIILVDEASDIIGSGKLKAEQKGEGVSNARLAEVGDRMTSKGRSEAVVMEWGTQRATVSKLGSGDLKSQCALRFALRTASEADAASIIPDDAAAARQLGKLRHNGTGLVWRQGGGRPQPVKFYRLDTHVSMDMERTLALAIENAECRPEFSAADLAALGEDYRTRWGRSELLARLRRSAPSAPSTPGPDPGQEQVQPRRQTAVMDREAEAAEFHRLTEGLASELDIPPEANKIHPSRAQVHAWLATRPDFGLDVPTIATMLRKAQGVDEVALGTLYKWMRADKAAGLVEERHGRYFLRRDRGQR